MGEILNGYGKFDRHEDNAIQDYGRPERLECEVDNLLVRGRN